MGSGVSSNAVAGNSAFGLIIGIGKYQDDRIPSLNFTRSDAQAMYDLLLDDQHVGFKAENVKLLLNEDATFFKIKNAISSWLFQRTDQDATVIIYYAGHGGQESDKTGSEKDGIAKYLLPWDCDRDDLFSSALSNTEFNRLLSTIKAKRLIFFMDACYAGGIMSSGARDISVGISDDLKDKLGQGEGRIIISSARANQRSWEDNRVGHGIFTHHLLDALKGQADTDNDGYVSIWEVYKYLEQKVPKSAREMAQSVQEPMLLGDISRDIYLTVNPGRIKEKSEELQKQEEETAAKMRDKQDRLFSFFKSRVITQQVFEEALGLLNKPAEQLSVTEKVLLRNLEALLSSGIDVETYCDNREAILAVKPDPSSDPSHNRDFEQKRYCTNCGTAIRPGITFCTGCGRRVIG